MRARFPGVESKCSRRRRDRRRATLRRRRDAALGRGARSARRSRRADVVLSGGGGLLQNATSLRSLLYYAGILREAIRANRKTMIFAQSIGPLDCWGRFDRSRASARACDRATVRDERSRAAAAAHCVRDTPIERTADPVFLYDVAERPSRSLPAEGLGPESGPYAIVSVRKIPARAKARQRIARARGRPAAQRHGIRIAFLPLGGAGDAEVSTDVIRACASEPVLLPECPLAKAAAILRGARVVVGMRLHALILAARYGVPFLAHPVRSESQRALRGSGVSAGAAVGAGRPASGRTMRSTRWSTGWSLSATLSRRTCASARDAVRAAAAARTSTCSANCVSGSMSETAERDYRATLESAEDRLSR